MAVGNGTSHHLEERKSNQTKQPQSLRRSTLPESSGFDGLTARRQATSNTITVKARLSLHGTRLESFQSIRPCESCPLDTMCFQAAWDTLQRETSRCDHGPGIWQECSLSAGTISAWTGHQLHRSEAGLWCHGGEPGWQRDGQCWEMQPCVIPASRPTKPPLPLTQCQYVSTN